MWAAETAWLTTLIPLLCHSGKYAAATALELGAITATFAAVDAASTAVGVESLPPAAVAATFFFLSLRSRVFSPLDNSRPDRDAAVKGEQAHQKSPPSQEEPPPPERARGLYFASEQLELKLSHATRAGAGLSDPYLARLQARKLEASTTA